MKLTTQAISPSGAFKSNRRTNPNVLAQIREAAHVATLGDRGKVLNRLACAFSVGLLMMTVPAVADEQVNWMDRCVAEADGNRDGGPRSDRFDFSTCLSTILNYCTFAAEPVGCFAQLESAYASRAADTLSKLPESIEGPEVQQKIYSRRIETIADMASQLPCPSEATPQMCGAKTAMSKWHLARSTVEWIEKFEDEK